MLRLLSHFTLQIQKVVNLCLKCDNLRIAVWSETLPQIFAE